MLGLIHHQPHRLEVIWLPLDQARLRQLLRTLWFYLNPTPDQHFLTALYTIISIKFIKKLRMIGA